MLSLKVWKVWKVYFTLKKHKAPGACTKLPRRLKTNLRYETSPQSRPVVGNTKLGELYWVLSDNKTSLQDFAVRAKQSCKQCPMSFLVLHGFVTINTWISPSCCMDLSKLIFGFLWVITWICQNWYMDFSKLFHGFVKIDTCISLSCYMDLSKSRHWFF